jgi:hypothetical protein
MPESMTMLQIRNNVRRRTAKRLRIKQHRILLAAMCGRANLCVTRGVSYSDFPRNTANKGMLDRCGRPTKKRDDFVDEIDYDALRLVMEAKCDGLLPMREIRAKVAY